MNPRRELQLAIGIVVVLNLGLALGAVGLFARMGPAIDRILDENATSIVATERMVLALAMHPDPGKDAAKQLQDDLALLTSNVTEPEESAVVDRLASEVVHLANPGMRERVLQDLVRVSEINHAAMDRAGVSAARIGNAGAWAAVWVGLLSLGLTLVVMSRLRERLIHPLEEVAEVVRESRLGSNGGRRCHSEDAPPQLQALMEDLNALLDQHSTQLQSALPDEREQRLRHIVQGLLEQRPEPTAICDEDGTLLFTNLPMLDALSTAQGGALRRALSGKSADDEPLGPHLQRAPLPKSDAVLWRISEPKRDRVYQR